MAAVSRLVAALAVAVLAGGVVGALPTAIADDHNECPFEECESEDYERPECERCFSDHGTDELGDTPEVCYESTGAGGCGCDPSAEPGAPGACVVEGPDGPDPADVADDPDGVTDLDDLTGLDDVTCEATPATPAPPPSLNHATLPAWGGDLEFDPKAEYGGLTGMETYIDLHYNSPTEAVWTVQGAPGITEDCEIIDAPTRTDSAQIVEYRWDLREATRTTSEPSVTHTYDTKDRDNHVQAWAIWTTSWGEQIAVPMADEPYPVREVRGRIIETQ